ncbi:MAG: CBS domain-containing protein [Rhodospirillaceae bacterium]|jgi:CBS domain-containing protein|nr:CBS domain-containing protein [Rhodospirillaceae bacterium]MBT3883792.1 CBS domain-containing protein [Rhodospirillaceae bacterium]MBT4115633.1 CBS domain-containing protein [Rhodospirillaceae bacterium]MBT4671339.1 CBS domain-containing protein [Rhodospirillaceae bacterium]MBT4719572.1 CBS domain-containing protein [Rhodospirillaceae bacterium]
MLQSSEPLVRDVLEGKDPRIISTKTNILATQAANLMATERVGIIIVVDDVGKFCGILSERDIVRAFGRFGAKAAQVTVGDIATRKVTACVTETPLARVQSLMKDGGFRHMPVVEDGRVKGIISIGDILGFLARAEEPA